MSIKDFQIESRLGEGSYSSVYKVKRIADGFEYAMKKVRMQSLNERQRQNALNQVRILASIKHPNIIGYKQAFIDDSSDSLIIIMEYAPQGDLQKKISHMIKTKNKLQQNQIWKIFTQMVKGLKVLHSLNIQHRDLKSANIFLGKDGVVKIGDLNVSKISTGLCQTQTGTPYYASPEVWKDQPYDIKSDIWALGCILYQMITLKPPFRAQDMQGLYKKVVRGFYQKIPSHFSQELSNVIRMMLQVLPQLRPDCDKLLNLVYSSQKNTSRQNQHSVTTKTSQNTLLDTIKISKDMRLLSDKLPKPDYSLIQMPEKIRKSQSRNSCPKNHLLPIINKAEQNRKKRYISQKKRQKPMSMATSGSQKHILIKQSESKLIKQSIKRRIPQLSKAVLQLPFITENDGSPKPKKIKKPLNKSTNE